MKIERKKAFKRWSTMERFAAAITFVGFLLLVSQCSISKTDDYCDHGFGGTTLQGRIIDFFTKKPIDSVEISIVYGASWDHYLDTVVKHNDTFSFTFDAPNDCDSYFVTLSRKYFWIDVEHHPIYKVSINKGEINDFAIELKPATFFQVNVRRNTLDRNPGIVSLEVKKDKEKEWQHWRDITIDDFTERPGDYVGVRYSFADSGHYRTISTFYDVEANVDYAIRWTQSKRKNTDTIYYYFKAIPFDTVRVQYAVVGDK